MPERYNRQLQYNKYLLRKVLAVNIVLQVKWKKGRLRLGTVYDERYLYFKEAQDIIKSSNFVRSIFFDLIENLIIINRYLLSSLFSIAILENDYP